MYSLWNILPAIPFVAPEFLYLQSVSVGWLLNMLNIVCKTYQEGNKYKYMLIYLVYVDRSMCF